MSFYSIVLFEGEAYLIRATESKALNEQDLKEIDAAMKEGKGLADIQETLENAWNR